jgi:MFS family permease
VVTLRFGVYAGALLSSYIWGWNADHRGSKPVMFASLLCYLLLPVCWSLLPRQGDGRLWLAIGISFLQGVAVSGWSIGYSRYLFVRLIPPGKRQAYLSVYYPWTEIMSGLGPLLAGAVLSRLASRIAPAWPAGADEYTVLFALSALLMLAALAPISRLGSDRPRAA